MNKLIKLINKAHQNCEDPTPAVRQALKGVQYATLCRWHDDCQDGTLMNCICEELDSRPEGR